MLLLVRVCSKLLHNTLFPRLVNKFAVASWRFIAKWLYPRANELVRLFPGTTSSSRCSLEKRNSRGLWAALHHQSSSTHLTPVARSSPSMVERAERGPRGTGRQGWPMEGRRAAGRRVAGWVHSLPCFPTALVQVACFATSPTSPEVKGDNFYPPLRGTVRQMALMVVRLSKQGRARTSAARLEAAVHSSS